MIDTVDSILSPFFFSLRILSSWNKVESVPAGDVQHNDVSAI